MAAESIAPVFFDAHFNSCDCPLFSMWGITSCAFFAPHRCACATLRGFTAVSHWIVWCWTSANLRHYQKKKKFSISPHLLRLSFSRTTEWVLNLKHLLYPVPCATWSSPAKPHRHAHVTTTNTKNRTFCCTDTNCLCSEFLVILQFRNTWGSGSSTLQCPFLHFLFIHEQLERWTCSFVSYFWKEVCERPHAYKHLINPHPLQQTFSYPPVSLVLPKLCQSFLQPF